MSYSNLNNQSNKIIQPDNLDIQLMEHQKTIIYAMKEYELNGKIDAKRLKYKGYGDSKPRKKNDTAENKQMNRRTEYKVISIAK